MTRARKTNRKQSRRAAAPAAVAESTSIVPASEADLPGLAKLAGVIWRACYPGIITVNQIEYMLERVYDLDVLRREMREGVRFERLLEDGEFVGFAGYGPAGAPVVYKLYKLYLHPSIQGRGLGRRLLEHCENAVRKLGARRLILNVNKKNDRAIGLYKRCGYKIAESVIVKIGGGFVMDDYVMAKDLGKQAERDRAGDSNRT